MKITVIGCGRWGSFIAWYLNRIGHEVSLYGRPSSKHMQEFQETGTNGMVTLPKSITLETNLSKATESDVIVISVNSQGLRGLMEELKTFHLEHKIFVLCMKGIEITTGKRLSEVVMENTAPSNIVAVWLGPGHVQEFTRGVPNCMVIDSVDSSVKQRLVDAFSSDLIRFYYGSDLIGNEIGGAAKNVIGIAAGMLDGLGLTSLKGALMSRGTREIARLIKAMGGTELSAYGLCHLGDYEATVFSQFSNNRRFGEVFIKGEEYTKLAEGYYTVKALMNLGKEYQVDLPICNAVYGALYDKADPEQTINGLFTRSLKEEF
ncbi:MAG: NAD(P)H-dependent glycerol-3-phosphate dehydrogenase [Bacillota bacterium]|nr:NAD(P)H-dependent glycerol-3-phosphate dehydrogenase [Bacillota bacterium]